MSNSLSPEDLAWLRQCAAVDGNTYDRLLLHLLERVVALEAARQQPHQDKLDRLIALDRGNDEPTPEAAPVATDNSELEEELFELYENHDTIIGALLSVCDLGFRRCVNTLGRQHGVAQPPVAQPDLPAALGDALIRAECALSDIAEGEETNAAPNTFKWAEQRCAEVLAIIRPVMQRHGIRTSEHLLAAQPAPPAAPAGGLMKRVGGAMERDYVIADIEGTWDAMARAAIREVADWLDLVGNKHSADELRREADR